jgi:beta-lactam-binding protein with PASTA domain
MVPKLAAVAVAILAAVLVGAPVNPARSVGLGDTLPIDPAQGLAGTVVQVTPTFGASSDCTVYWDGAPVTEFACGSATGAYPSTEVVATGPPGIHTIAVCAPTCDSVDAVPRESAQFVVQTVVPDLANLPVDGDGGATSRLADADLVLGTVTGPTGDPAAVVVTQSLASDTLVAPGTVVDVTIADPSTTKNSVLVPDLRGLRVDNARNRLSARGLVLVVSSGSGLVVDQRPAPQTRVARGAQVTVTLQAAPSRLVAVPDVRHLTVQRARAVLTAAHLVPDVHGARNGRVTAQTPRPGVLVRRGSSVSLTVAAPPVLPPHPRHGALRVSPAAYAVTGSSVAAIAVLAGWLLFRHRRARRPAPQREPTASVVLRPGSSQLELRTNNRPSGPRVEIRCHQRTSVEIEESQS